MSGTIPEVWGVCLWKKQDLGCFMGRLWWISVRKNDGHEVHSECYGDLEGILNELQTRLVSLSDDLIYCSYLLHGQEGGVQLISLQHGSEGHKTSSYKTF